MVEKFDGYENLEDTIDALAQEQIQVGNEVQITSDAKIHSGTKVEESERAAVIRECDVRHELGQALQRLLQSYEYQIHRSMGKDSEARRGQ